MRFDPRKEGVQQTGNPHQEPEAEEGRVMSKVAVFGAGSWGTAFSMILADAGNDVTIWGRREDVCSTINDKHENTDYLPGIELPPTISATHDPEKALAGAELMVLAVPSQTLRENLTEWADLIPRDTVLVSLMKGVELGRLKRMSEVIAEVTGAGPERIAVVSGPNLAERDRAPRARGVGGGVRRRGRRQAGAGDGAHAGVPARTRRPTCWAARSVAPTRTWSASASAWPPDSASATTRPRR